MNQPVIPARFDRLKKIGAVGKPSYEINFDPAYLGQVGVPNDGDRAVVFLVAGRRYGGMFSHRQKVIPPKVYSRSPLEPLDPDEPVTSYRGGHSVGTILYERHGIPVPAELELRLSPIQETEGATLLVEVIHPKLTPPAPVLPPTPPQSCAPPDSTGAGFGDAETNAEVEKAAVDAVTKKYKADGWTVDDVSKQNLGYDLDCRCGEKIRHVEVKGVSGELEEFIITRNEVETAKANPAFVLAVVTRARTTAPIIREYTGPEMLARFGLTPISFKATPKK